MDSLKQFFLARMRAAIRTSLTCLVSIYLTEVFTALETNMAQDIEKLPKSSIEPYSASQQT